MLPNYAKEIFNSGRKLASTVDSPRSIKTNNIKNWRLASKYWGKDRSDLGVGFAEVNYEIEEFDIATGETIKTFEYSTVENYW